MLNEYYIMYKNIPVLEFNTLTKTVKHLNVNLLPFSIRNKLESWDSVRVFCSSRMLMTNREYCKEILTSCCIDDQTDVNICIISKALSFRDNYWIKSKGSCDTWESVNLYNNTFSTDIAYTALTGETSSVRIGDNFYTGELTNKGTRAKCYIRKGKSIYLLKNETKKEIFSEILSYNIAKALGLHSTKYAYLNAYGKDCSVCQIFTSESIEMLPCREVISHYNCDMKMDSEYYREFLRCDSVNFMLMHLFDFLTLNTDRNRDNFALRFVDGEPSGLYPVFDHDSCFKGISIKAHYFVTGLSFDETFKRLYTEYSELYNLVILPAAKLLLSKMRASGYDYFKTCHLGREFEPFIKRIECVIRAKFD